MKRLGVLLVALACTAGVGSQDVTWALGATGEGAEVLREWGTAAIDGRGLWQQSLEAQRLPDVCLDGTLTTTTASQETVAFDLHLVGRLAEDGMSRMLLLRVAGTGSLAGSAFLTVERRKAPHDVWIYLPALGAPRRLFASNLAESFLGSEFRFGDLLQPDPEDYAVTVRGADYTDEKPCWVIEAVPQDPAVERQTGLGRQVLWLGKDDGLERRVEQFDRRGRLLKIAEVVRWASVLDGRRWLATERRIRNVQTGAWTSVVFERVAVGVGIDAAHFGPQHLLDRSW